MTRGFPEKGGRHGDDGLKIGREGMQPVREFVGMARARRSRSSSGMPRSFPTPHTTRPRAILKKYLKEGRPVSVAKYYAMCEWFDETCGELIDILDRSWRAREHTHRLRDRQWLDPGADAATVRTPLEADTLRGRRAHADPVLVAWKDPPRRAARNWRAASTSCRPCWPLPARNCLTGSARAEPAAEPRETATRSRAIRFSARVSPTTSRMSRSPKHRCSSAGASRGNGNCSSPTMAK